MSYNGYKNYQTWNVCLWICNDEGLYEFAAVCQDYNDFKARLRESLSQRLNNSWNYTSAIAFETPDGVSWNDSGVDNERMKEFWEENFSKVSA